MSGGEASSASCSVKARLSFTACSAKVTLRWRRVASVRVYAATSSAAFLDDTSSIAWPLPATGWAAPMLVPGAIAAMSAAMVRMKPAEAARDPAGPTKTATGVRAASIRVTMSRVESTRPPGVRSVNTTSDAFARSAASMVAIMNSGGDRVNDAVDVGGVDDRRGVSRGLGRRGRRCLSR